MSNRLPRAGIIGGVRIPFCRNNTAYADVGNFGMAVKTLGALVERFDLHGAERLDDIEHIEATLRDCVSAACATLLHIHLHHFQPSGVSGVAVLAESHISVHTWPEKGFAAFDVFMCGHAEPRKALDVFKRAFEPGRVVVGEHKRGVV